MRVRIQERKRFSNRALIFSTPKGMKSSREQMKGAGDEHTSLSLLLSTARTRAAKRAIEKLPPSLPHLLETPSSLLHERCRCKILHTHPSPSRGTVVKKNVRVVFLFCLWGWMLLVYSLLMCFFIEEKLLTGRIDKPLGEERRSGEEDENKKIQKGRG